MVGIKRKANGDSHAEQVTCLSASSHLKKYSGKERLGKDRTYTWNPRA
jgi:hypothetical protein